MRLSVVARRKSCATTLYSTHFLRARLRKRDCHRQTRWKRQRARDCVDRATRSRSNNARRSIALVLTALPRRSIAWADADCVRSTSTASASRTTARRTSEDIAAPIYSRRFPRDTARSARRLLNRRRRGLRRRRTLGLSSLNAEVLSSNRRTQRRLRRQALRVQRRRGCSDHYFSTLAAPRACVTKDSPK